MRSFIASTAMAVGLLVVVTPAAQAGRYVYRDGAGDVHTLIDQGKGALAPDRARGDITRVAITNGRRAVRLGMTLRDLAGPDEIITATFNVQNGRHRTRHVSIDIAADSVSAPRVTNGADNNVRCRGMRSASVSAATRILTVTVPRACFNRPKVLRLNANTEGRSAADVRTTYVDDALTAGYPDYPHDFQSPVVWTPWVKRG